MPMASRRMGISSGIFLVEQLLQSSPNDRNHKTYKEAPKHAKNEQKK
jgi:hypothetical protein